MKQPDDIRAAQERFAKLAEGFDPKEHGKEHPLDPFEEHIKSLRGQGASYKVVKHLLEQAGVTVCVATVARFCQANGLNPPKRKAGKKTRAKQSKKTAQPQQKTPEEDSNNDSSPATAKRRRGPRIANPNDI